jgi:hypothetical protein
VDMGDEFTHKRIGQEFEPLKQALSSGHVRCQCILRYLVLREIRTRR